MSIRCEVHLGVTEGKDLIRPVRIYKHFDGHPEYMIPFLKEFIGWNRYKNKTDPGVIGANFIYWAKMKDEADSKRGVRSEKGAIDKFSKLLKKKMSHSGMTKDKGFGFVVGADYMIMDSTEKHDSFVTYAYLVVYQYRKRKEEKERLELGKITITTLRVPGDSEEPEIIDTIEIERG